MCSVCVSTCILNHFGHNVDIYGLPRFRSFPLKSPVVNCIMQNIFVTDDFGLIDSTYLFVLQVRKSVKCTAFRIHINLLITIRLGGVLHMIFLTRKELFNKYIFNSSVIILQGLMFLN